MTHPARYCPNKVQKPIRGSLLNRSHPMARGLAACWLMNEGTGTKIANICNPDFLTGTTVNMDDTNWVGGRGGHALYSNGYDEYITCGNSTNPGTNLALEILVYPESVADYKHMLAYGHLYDSNYGYKIYIEVTKLMVNVGWSYPNLSNCPVVTINNWWHFLVNFNVTTGFFEMYVNGLFAYSETIGTAGGWSTTGNRILGNTSGGVDPLLGRCEFARIWHRMLSAEEAAWLYREPYCMF